MLLLHAALDPADAAVDAWRTWEAKGGWRAVHEDPFALRMLPTIYRRLVDHSSAVEILQPYYEEARAANLHLFARCAALVRMLQQEKIPVIVLKGTALSLLYYQDIGARPMSDFDVMVSRNCVERSMQILRTAGLQPRVPLVADASAELLTVHHAWPMRKDDENAPWEFDLHWRLLADYPNATVDAELQRCAQTLHVYGVETRALCATDMLFHVCVHGFAWAPMPSMRWIADAMTILRCAGERIDWGRMITIAADSRAGLPLQQALAFLVDRFGAPIDQRVLKQLLEIPTTASHRAMHRALTQRSEILGRLPVHIHRRRASFPEMSFAEYIAAYYGLEGSAAVMRWGLGKAAARMAALLRR